MFGHVKVNIYFLFILPAFSSQSKKQKKGQVPGFKFQFLSTHIKTSAQVYEKALYAKGCFETERRQGKGKGHKDSMAFF